MKCVVDLKKKQKIEALFLIEATPKTNQADLEKKNKVLWPVCMSAMSWVFYAFFPSWSPLKASNHINLI